MSAPNTPPPFPDRLERQLRLAGLRPEIEPLARELVEKSQTGSQSLWDDLTEERMREDPDYRRRFFALAHDGMYAAQEQMIARIQTGEPLTNSEDVLFRGVADSMAWQMIQGQLCYARRLFKGQRPPSFADSSFESVVGAARHMRELEPYSMPLIADLTSLVQVGDLMVAVPDKGLSMVEVKSGAENHRLLDMLTFYRKSGCEHFREILSQTEPKHTVKQFERMRRQASRLEFFGDVMNKGLAHDPDTGIQIAIPEKTIIMESWDEALGPLIEKAKEKGWAYDVQGSVHLGCYAGEGPMLHGGHIAFLGSLAGVGNIDEDYRVARMIDAMSIPLAPPVFNRPLPGDSMFDLLFGRMNICMAINVPQLVEDCEMLGMDARSATRRELAEVRRLGGAPVLYQGKGIYFSLDGHSMMLMDGVIFRALFMGERPESVIRGFLQNQQELDDLMTDATQLPLLDS